jgi:hypothetical protein
MPDGSIPVVVGIGELGVKDQFPAFIVQASGASIPIYKSSRNSTG